MNQSSIGTFFPTPYFYMGQLTVCFGIAPGRMDMIQKAVYLIFGLLNVLDQEKHLRWCESFTAIGKMLNGRVFFSRILPTWRQFRRDFAQEDLAGQGRAQSKSDPL